MKASIKRKLTLALIAACVTAVSYMVYRTVSEGFRGSFNSVTTSPAELARLAAIREAKVDSTNKCKLNTCAGLASDKKRYIPCVMKCDKDAGVSTLPSRK